MHLIYVWHKILIISIIMNHNHVSMTASFIVIYADKLLEVSAFIRQ